MMAGKKREPGFATLCIHGKKHLDKHEGEKPIRAVSTPIFQSSTFAFENAEHGAAVFRGEDSSYVYTRLGNPTTAALESEMAYLEKGEAALALASGMAAATTAVLTCCQAGDHIVAGDTLYGGTHQLFTQTLPRLGINVTEVPAYDPANFAKAITKKTKLIYLETPANPPLVLTDIAAVAEIAQAKGIPVLVDNTFCTPYLQNPLELGADIVLHSATKYIGGHGDTVAGILVGSNDWIMTARMETLRDVGGCISPFNSWLLLRGLKTLALRMDRHNQNGQAVAEWLENDPRIRQVWYPGLKSHPDHDVAVRQMNGFGGVVTFEIETDLQGAMRFIDATRIPYQAPSLGGVESLIELPITMSYWDIPQEERLSMGITDSLVRLACGIEDQEDLIADLDQALSHV
jgi:methionine-gamma-lyase